MREIGHFIGGKTVKGTSGRFGDVFNPNTGEVQAKVALAKHSEVEHAIANAEAAQAGWAATNPQRRARVMFKFLDLVAKDMDNLAKLLSSEHGKVLADARGDIQRGVEVVEFACGIPHLLKGEYSEAAGPGIDLYSMHQPLGVVAGITPFNFPAMIPLWKCAPAIACGNAFILKPSERDPSVPMRIAELFLEAGLPPGILNVVNGDKEAVDTLLNDPRVHAIGFVGSSAIAEVHLFDRLRQRQARAVLRRRQEPHDRDADADMDQAVDALIGAGYGSAGERCMAVSVAVPVGKKTADILLEKLIPARREPQDRPLHRRQGRLRPDGHAPTARQGARLHRYRRQGRREARGRRARLQIAGLRERQFHRRLLFDDVKPERRSTRKRSSARCSRRARQGL